MTTTIVVYSSIYLGFLLFILGTLRRALEYARAPYHLRWELYPVPHEEASRVAHGGSYFETVDWWTKPTHFNLWGEVKAMVPEMLFLKGLWDFNRSLWFCSFPFHFGLYLLIGTIGLLVAQVGLAAFLPGVMLGSVGAALTALHGLTGWLGAGMVIVGALALLVRRLADRRLRPYTTPGDIFNLLFFILTFGMLVAAYLTSGGAFPGAVAFTHGLLTFDAQVRLPGLLVVGLVFGASLAAYIPFTHMSHFVAKYFTYHAVRWDDTASERAPRLQQRLAEYLTFRPTWAAPHIGADGRKTWAEIAASNPAQEARK
jgi:nitrate reductase gamma subunit